MQGAIAGSAPINAFISELNPFLHASDFWKVLHLGLSTASQVATAVPRLNSRADPF